MTLARFRFHKSQVFPIARVCILAFSLEGKPSLSEVEGVIRARIKADLAPKVPGHSLAKSTIQRPL